MNGHEPSRRAAGRTDDRRRGLLAIGLAAIACAVVAVAAAKEPLRAAGEDSSRLTLNPWLLLIPFAAVIGIGLIGLASLRGVHRSGPTRKRSVWLTVVGFLVFAAVVSRLGPQESASPEVTTTFEVAPAASSTGAHHATWPTWFAVGVAALVAVAAVVASRRTTRPRRAEAEASPNDVRRVVEETMSELSEPVEPRQAVIAAYAHLLAGLARSGAGRRPAEAPFEHVTRVLATLGVRPEPLRELTALFAEARFSTHDITEQHRAAALAALDDARADLEGIAA